MNNSLFGKDSEIESLDEGFDDEVLDNSNDYVQNTMLNLPTNHNNEETNNVNPLEDMLNKDNSENTILENNSNDTGEANSISEPVSIVEPVVEENSGQFHIFKCKDCSVTFGKYMLEEVNKCVLCESTHLDSIDDDLDVGQYIIPFNYSSSDAINDYKKYVGFNPLIPRVFKSKKTISSISKVYVSSELFDINATGNVSFYAGDKVLAENKEELKKFDVTNNVNFDFKNVLMCGSSKISSPIFLGVSDYDFNQIKKYDSSIVGDSQVLFSDLSPMDISTYATNMVMDYSLSVIRKNVNHQLKKVNKNNIKVDFTNNKFILVPMYLLNVSYNGHSYTYIMNGNTGKSSMKITYGKTEIIIMSIISFILIFALCLLFVYLV